MMKKIVTICSAVFLLSGCVALQQDVITLERRMETLEFRNRELQKQNEKLAKQFENSGANLQNSEKSIRSQYAGLNADMEAMQDELRLLNGRVEEIQYQTNRKVSDYETSSQKSQERLDTINVTLDKFDKRLTRVEQYLNLGGKGAAATGQATATAVPAKSDVSEAQLYSDARKAYDNGDLDKARQLFQKLIKEFPKSKNVDNAQFWIGESYYREKWYERAILEYQTVIEKYPNGNKVPAAMLKQGMALQQIGEKPSARLILEELVKKYPKSSEAAVAGRKLKEF
jgi:tol-pal system protein YbgF